METPLSPVNPLVCPALTDLYQVTMAYAYWKCGKSEDFATFDLYFRKNPFNGQYTVFCGLEEALRFISSYKWPKEAIDFLRLKLPHCENEFFDYLSNIDCSKVKVYALKEGSIAFPNVPLLRVEGSLAICQLLETTLLSLINYPSLIATNAARYRVAAESTGKKKELLEFGLRRAQGPDGGVTASKYAYVGGFNATSNIMAGTLFNIEVKGTHAHSFITSFTSEEDLPKARMLRNVNTGEEVDFAALVFKKREALEIARKTNTSELVAFIAYALSFPKNFIALVDTYNTLKTGVPNFLCVALALDELGYNPIGIRIDSGDLAYLSIKCREMFKVAAIDFNRPHLERLKICASSDIDEEVLYSLNREGHEIDIFGIGTNLVVCSGHPALGCVYKLVQINNKPRIKLSSSVSKVTIPGRKEAYRLVGKEGGPVMDIMVEAGSPPPKAGEKIYCRHPFDETKRCYVLPTEVEPLHHLVWDGKLVNGALRPLSEVRDHCIQSVDKLRPDHKYITKPTPYKVSVSRELYKLFHEIWLEEAPIEQID